MSNPLVWDKEALLERIDNDEEMLEELIEDFNDCIDEMLEELESVLQNSDWETVERQAHTIKGMLANIGADYAKETAFKIEDIARSDTPSKSCDFINELRNRINELTAVLKAQ